MVTPINHASLLNYLSAPGQDGASAGGAAATGLPARAQDVAQALSAAALQRAAGTGRNAAAAQRLQDAQKTLSADLRAALARAGVQLGGTVEFAVTSDGAVDVKGSEADQAAVKAFLKADASQPGFAGRIATQARDALQLSSTVQQSAAISQAARLSGTPGGVMALYASLMQQAGAASVVFSVSATSSALTYPGALAADA